MHNRARSTPKYLRPQYSPASIIKPKNSVCTDLAANSGLVISSQLTTLVRKVSTGQPWTTKTLYTWKGGVVPGICFTQGLLHMDSGLGWAFLVGVGEN